MSDFCKYRYRKKVLENSQKFLKDHFWLTFDENWENVFLEKFRKTFSFLF